MILRLFTPSILDSTLIYSTHIFTQALIHGLNRHYYSIPIKYRMNEKEQQMLLNLHKKSWLEGLTLQVNCHVLFT